MDKANVLKAMELCADPLQYVNGCAGCPYEGTEECDKHLLEDAIKLIKESETSQPNANYSLVYMYTKKANLLPYLKTDKIYMRWSGNVSESYHQHCAEERDIQLMAMFRFENGKCFCRIKCPINPMPTNEEFSAVSITAVGKFLKEHGWVFKQKLNPSMFQ